MKPRGRPRKIRNIKEAPKTLIFSPRGKPGRPDEVSLKYEELEALRLADLNNLKHIDAASSMGISRQSFERVLKRARRAMTEGLTKGKIIRISGGSYKLISEEKGKRKGSK
jgi:predicted DNA-binding protein (UPF0251 family)